jgi:acyl-CoA synthetase (AMP-forming)/AMP-acid ligase II
MTGVEHRKPGLAVAALLEDDAYVELIADGHNVRESVWPLILRAKPADRLILVSDGVSFGGTSTRTGLLGGLEVVIDGDRCVLVDGGNLAGSVIALDTAVRNVARSGIALPGIGLRVVDGRIEVRGPTMMSGYWNHTPLSPEEWFDTGDMGEIDDRGRLAVHARRTDLIVTGGENVYPAEVEAALESCPGIESAAVFGLPHDTWGQIVVAVLVADGEPPADEKLRAFLDARLAPHKRPRRIGYVKEMPHTRGGKLHRAALHVIANAMHDL